MANLVATALAVVAFASSGDGQLVLGSKSFGDLRYGIGWGTTQPRVVYNGGDPSGKVWHIRWSDWGGTVALGGGLTWLHRPQGGYYTTGAEIELRAFGIGRCSSKGPRAYLHLKVRVPARPGGPLGPWYLWGGSHSICRST